MSAWPAVPHVFGTRAWQLAVCLDEYRQSGASYWRDEAIFFARELACSIDHFLASRQRLGGAPPRT